MITSGELASRDTALEQITAVADKSLGALHSPSVNSGQGHIGT